MQDDMATTFVVLTAVGAFHVVHKIPIIMETLSTGAMQIDANIRTLPLYPTAGRGRIVLFIQRWEFFTHQNTKGVPSNRSIKNGSGSDRLGRYSGRPLTCKGGSKNLSVLIGKFLFSLTSEAGSGSDSGSFPSLRPCFLLCLFFFFLCVGGR